MEKLLFEYLDYEDIPVSPRYLKKLLLSHSDYPTFLSIADVLDRLGINKKIAQVDINNFENISFPYLCQDSNDDRNLKLIRNVEEYKKFITGVESDKILVIKVEPTDTIIDKGNDDSIFETRFLKGNSIIFCIAVLGLLCSVSICSFSWFSIAILITAMIGFTVGVILIAKDLDMKFDAIESFCKGGNNVGCNNVLNSDKAKLIGDIKLSDLTVIYFCYQFLMVGLFSHIYSINSVYALLFILSYLTIPIVIYSVYYQIVTGSWCKLCLIIDLLLIMQVLLFTVSYGINITSISSIEYDSLLSSAFLFIILSTGIFLLKVILKKANDLIRYEVGYKRLKRSDKVFYSLVLTNKKIDTNKVEQLRIGNKNANIKLTLVGDLYCNPCKKAHAKVGQLIKTYPKHVNVSLAMMLGTDEDMSKSTINYIIKYWLTYIKGRENESYYTEKLFSDWYNILDLNDFKSKFPIESNKYEELSKRLGYQHISWADNIGIQATPSLIINGYLAPREYNLDDMMTLVPTLKEFFSATPIIQKV